MSTVKEGRQIRVSLRVYRALLQLKSERERATSRVVTFDEVLENLLGVEGNGKEE